MLAYLKRNKKEKKEEEEKGRKKIENRPRQNILVIYGVTDV